jgi:hypothetical protein
VGIGAAVSEEFFVPDEQAAHVARTQPERTKLQRRFTPGAVLILKVIFKFKKKKDHDRSRKYPITCR